MAFIKGRAYPIIKSAAEGNGPKAELAKAILAGVESMTQDELDSKLSDFFGGAAPSETGDEPATTGQNDVPDANAPVAASEGKTKTGKLKMGVLEAKKSTPDGRNETTFKAGAINQYFKIDKPTDETTVDKFAEKIGFTKDPEIAKALKEFNEDFNDTSRQTMIFDPKLNKKVYNMGSEQANTAREAEGKAWINKEIEKQSKRTIKKDKQAYIVVGLPGSGKSTTADPMLAQFGAYEIDSDIFKDYTPEMQGEENRAASVHDESGTLRDEFMKITAKEGANMVIPTVGHSVSSIKKRIDDLKKLGYKDFHLINAYAPLDKALERNVKRFKFKKANKKPIRLVGLRQYVDNSIEKINNAFEESLSVFKDDIKSWAVYDGTADGVKPSFVDGSDNWDDFIKDK
jgi:adenylate kinase family enzyme